MKMLMNDAGDTWQLVPGRSRYGETCSETERTERQSQPGLPAGWNYSVKNKQNQTEALCTVHMDAEVPFRSWGDAGHGRKHGHVRFEILLDVLSRQLEE